MSVCVYVYAFGRFYLLACIYVCVCVCVCERVCVCVAKQVFTSGQNQHET